MSFLRFLFPTRLAMDDPAKDRWLKQWVETGAPPVAHMVADLGAADADPLRPVRRARTSPATPKRRR